MIRYNFDRVFKARGIERPFTFLKRSGFSENFATKVNNNNVTVLRLKEMEKLCIILRCTPNDFMEWTPNSDVEVGTDHPIYTIRKSNKVVDITKILNSVPLNKLDEIEQLINKRLNTKSEI